MTLLRRTMVERRRLLDVLDDRLACRLTTISAGGGFGKSTLIAQAIEQSPLDAGAEILVECQRVGRPQADVEHVARELADALGAADTSITAIADAVLARSPSDVVIWLDDVHLLDQTEQRWCAELLEALPGNGHLVLAGRTMPELRTSRLDAAGLVTRLTEEQLRFDDDERAAFGHLRGSGGSTEAEGWPALMELEVSSGRSGALGYLADEVLAGVGEHRLAALRRLASLESFDAAMIAAVTEFDGGPGELVAGLPLARIEQVDGETKASLHDLLRDALQRPWCPQERVDAETAVALELERRRADDEALRRFALLDDRSGVERVTRRMIADLHYASAQVDRSAAVSLVRDYLGDHVLAIAFDAVTSAVHDPATAIEALEAAVERAAACGETGIQALALQRLAEISYSSGRVEPCAAYAAQLDRLSATGDPEAQRLRFLPQLYLRRMTGRDVEIPPLVDAFLAGGPVDDEMRAVALFYRTVSLAYVGRVREAVADVDRLAPELPSGLFANRVGGVVATQKWQLGELTASDLAATRRLVDSIGASGQMQLFVEGAAATAIFHATAGEVEVARRLVDQAERRLATLGDQAWSPHTVAQARAVLDVIDGDEAAAADRLEASIPAAGPIDGLPSHVYFFASALTYLLVPRTRPAWEAYPVAPDLGVRLDVARALVALREEGDAGPAAELPWHEPDRIRPFAVAPHLIELAVAASAAGVGEAASVLQSVRHDAFVVLEHLAGSTNESIASAARTAIKVTPRRPTDVVEIGVLGPLRVRRSGVVETAAKAWRGAGPRNLLALLVHHRRVRRSDAAAWLWPDSDRNASQNNLRVSLSHLLSAFQPGRSSSDRPWFVRAEGDELVLVDSAELVLDVDRFRAHVDRADAFGASAPRSALPELTAACDLYRGDYLADTIDHGSASGDRGRYFETFRLRSDFVRAATRAAELLLAMGESDRAAHFAIRASEAEPFNEPAIRVLASTLLHQRRIGAATEVLAELLDHLHSLQIPAEPETRRLAARLRLGE